MPDDVRKSAPQRIVRLGEREVVTLGVKTPLWSDFYHHAMQLSWPSFFAAFMATFLVLNLVFASLYLLGDAPVANTQSGFADLFFFSIETLATVGYGDMHPQTIYGHAVATVEIFTGLSILAVMTGLVFARFSRPRARVLFAQVIVVGLYDGERRLMVRIANARGNMITEATARLWISLEEPTREGQTRRRFTELILERAENPLFALSWTISHLVDDASPLNGVGPQDLERMGAVFVLTCAGLDESFSQRVTARRTYQADEVRFGRRYSDILDIDETGRVRVDYRRFDHIEPDGLAGEQPLLEAET